MTTRLPGIECNHDKLDVSVNLTGAWHFTLINAKAKKVMYYYGMYVVEMTL